MRSVGRVVWLVGAFAMTAPGLVFKLAGLEASPPTEALIFGCGILGASFLLSWAAEVAQMEMSQALALALLALIAIMPEYAVDLYFAWRAAEELRHGTVHINETTNYWDQLAPFGGAKKSGTGRELAGWIIDALTETKQITFDLAD